MAVNQTIRAMGNPRQLLGSSSSLTNLTFIWWDKVFPGCRVDAVTIKGKKKRLKICLPLGYTFYNLPWSMQLLDLHWMNHNIKLHTLLKTYNLHYHPQSSDEDNRTEIICMRLNKLLNTINILMIFFCPTYSWLLIFVFRYKNVLLLKIFMV